MAPWCSSASEAPHGEWHQQSSLEREFRENGSSSCLQFGVEKKRGAFRRLQKRYLVIDSQCDVFCNTARKPLAAGVMVQLESSECIEVKPPKQLKNTLLSQISKNKDKIGKDKGQMPHKYFKIG